jgi:uncharacterized protein YjbJ (UPF0337 family)
MNAEDAAATDDDMDADEGREEYTVGATSSIFHQ